MLQQISKESLTTNIEIDQTTSHGTRLHRLEHKEVQLKIQ